jgi:hypothetical protein
VKEVLVNREFFITPLAVFIRASFTEAMTGIVMISLLFLYCTAITLWMARIFFKLGAAVTLLLALLLVFHTTLI